jgi:Ser-tRNA(Ala) deacylase AlaX
MYNLQTEATILAFLQGEDGRRALILDSTIFHPQGGGQPYDTGFITHSSGFKFVVQDVRSKDGIVYHYGIFYESELQEFNTGDLVGIKVLLSVDEPRRRLNSRLHSAGHLLDVCTTNVGLGHLESGKAYHFPDGPYVEYRGTVPQNELQTKQKELELDANKLISSGAKVFAASVTYDEACKLCGGYLPDYIPEDSCPRIVTIGNNPGCPCGGTHVSDISEIISMKVCQIRTKKGMTKVFYDVER